MFSITKVENGGDPVNIYDSIFTVQVDDTDTSEVDISYPVNVTKSEYLVHSLQVFPPAKAYTLKVFGDVSSTGTFHLMNEVPRLITDTEALVINDSSTIYKYPIRLQFSGTTAPETFTVFLSIQERAKP